MRLTQVHADGFLSLRDVRLDVPPRLLAVTGPNAAGKSNLARCLDLARLALQYVTTGEEPDRLTDLRAAGFDGTDRFTVSLDLTLDQPWEKDAVRAFTTLAVAGRMPVVEPDEADREAREQLDPRSADILLDGRLTIHHDSARLSPWEVSWHFTGYELSLHRRRMRNFADDRERDIRVGLSGPTPPGRLDVRAILPSDGEPFTLEVSGAYLHVVPDSLRTLISSGIVPPPQENRSTTLTFATILSAVLHRSLILVGQRRGWDRTVAEVPDEVPDLSDGRNVPAALLSLQNAQDDERLHRMRRAFRRLTGRDVHASISMRDGELVVRPTLTGDGGVPRAVELAGTGAEEALHLALLLSAPPGCVLVLDEPATNQSRTRQTQLLDLLREDGRQTILITHTPALVPAATDGDDAVIRLAHRPDGTVVHGPLRMDPRTAQLIFATDVRNLLFGRAVVLCEGDTEIGALTEWWDGGEHPPEFVPVGGDKAFGAYIDLAEQMGLPWAAVCDGPALRPGRGAVHKYLHQRGLVAPTGDFAAVKAEAGKAGVFTFADRFGDDGDKAGEFEAYLSTVDPAAHTRAGRAHPRSKVRAGRAFALATPCPPEADRMWQAITTRLAR